MTSLAMIVRGELDPRCLVESMNQQGCKVSLKGIDKPRLIVDFDKPGSPSGLNETRCDYLFIAKGDNDYSWVALLELKKGQLHVEQVVRQLQGSADSVEQLVPGRQSIRFRPIAVSGRVSKAERRRLRRKNANIKFLEQSEPIRLLSCGGRLVQALKTVK